MNSPNQKPEVIFYLGPEGSGKTRRILRTMDISPRSLIITMDQDPYEFRSCHWHDFPCGCEENIRSLHSPLGVRIVGQRSWQAAVLGCQVYDRVFFYQLPELFRSEADALDLSLALARLALIRSAQVVVRLNFDDERAIDHWEAPLAFDGTDCARGLGFWINMQAGPVRYLRLSALELVRRYRRGGNASGQETW